MERFTEVLFIHGGIGGRGRCVGGGYVWGGGWYAPLSSWLKPSSTAAIVGPPADIYDSPNTPTKAHKSTTVTNILAARVR